MLSVLGHGERQETLAGGPSGVVLFASAHNVFSSSSVDLSTGINQLPRAYRDVPTRAPSNAEVGLSC